MIFFLLFLQSLGGLTNATYTYFAKESVNGLHNAPYPQYVILLSGAARVTVSRREVQRSHFVSSRSTYTRTSLSSVIPSPNLSKLPNDTAVEEFSVGVMNIATDLPSESDHGHLTTWAANTAVIQAPFNNSTGPIHTVIHQGPCKKENFYFTNGTADP